MQLRARSAYIAQRLGLSCQSAIFVELAAQIAFSQVNADEAWTVVQPKIRGRQKRRAWLTFYL